MIPRAPTITPMTKKFHTRQQHMPVPKIRVATILKIKETIVPFLIYLFLL